MTSLLTDKVGRANLLHAEDSRALGDSFGTPGRCDSPVLKSLNLRFCTNQDVASSSTVKLHRKGKSTLGGIRAVPWPSDLLGLPDGKKALLQTGTRLLVQPTLQPFVNLNAHYLRLFMGIHVTQLCKNLRHSSRV